MDSRLAFLSATLAGPCNLARCRSASDSSWNCPQGDGLPETDSIHAIKIENTREPVFRLPRFRYLVRLGASTSGDDQARTNGIFGQFHHVVQFELAHQIAAMNIDRAG